MHSASNGHKQGQTPHDLVAAHFESSATLPERFFQEQAPNIARACWDMARRFHQGGRLLAFGNGAWASDAQHIAVEFVHPVIMGKRALPALALTNDSALLSGLAPGQEDGAFVRQLQTLARAQDIAVAFSGAGRDANVLAGLSLAQRMGLLTLGLCGGDGGQMARAGLDHCFIAPGNALLQQEIHETLYHVLWELVHVYFEHEGLLV